MLKVLFYVGKKLFILVGISLYQLTVRTAKPGVIDTRLFSILDGIFCTIDPAWLNNGTFFTDLDHPKQEFSKSFLMVPIPPSCLRQVQAVAMFPGFCTVVVTPWKGVAFSYGVDHEFGPIFVRFSVCSGLQQRKVPNCPFTVVTCKEIHSIRYEITAGSRRTSLCTCVANFLEGIKV